EIIERPLDVDLTVFEIEIPLPEGIRLAGAKPRAGECQEEHPVGGIDRPAGLLARTLRFQREPIFERREVVRREGANLLQAVRLRDAFASAAAAVSDGQRGVGDENAVI